ncbi:hypothetical protein Y032_0384g413 [Ancylostoma ceylanicum]|uniref:Uncharacterized protein n=1 Tax=Ancylostoma ceylanicum TaxID=53326 RepID=A0A016RU01_9BILA|nr:hypothetical protein Y032_0384g413 [Ancylostoma ceylanicum]
MPARRPPRDKSNSDQIGLIGALLRKLWRSDGEYHTWCDVAESTRSVAICVEVGAHVHMISIESDAADAVVSAFYRIVLSSLSNFYTADWIKRCLIRF